MNKLRSLFDVTYGTKFDFNKMEICEDDFPEGINFVSRTSQNNGIVAKVKKNNNKSPLDKGQITVSLGGSYVLSAFLQLEEFYTAQNVAVLKPLEKLSERELFYYCMCITKNRFRYGAFGREANVTLKDLLIPSKNEIPNRVYTTKIPDYADIKDPLENKEISLSINDLKIFKIKNVFSISLGSPIHKSNIDDIEKGNVAYVTRTTVNNGIELFLDVSELNCKVYNGPVITVGAEGFKAFFQDSRFITGNKVNILNNRKLNKYNAMFINTILNFEIKNKFGYGRAIVKNRLENLEIKLPVDNSGNPDRKFMEDYIKSLPYSKYL
ncbi:MAG: restriction endonuclease subunit S [Candidatus Absconditabacterales bacterium]